MPNFKQSGSALLAATLLATTTLTAPSQALADGRGLVRLAQADDPAPAEGDPELLPPKRERPAPAEDAAPARGEEAPREQPEPPAAESAPPAPAAESPAPVEEAPAPEPQRREAPAVEAPPPPPAGEAEAPPPPPAAEAPAPAAEAPAPAPEAPAAETPRPDAAQPRSEDAAPAERRERRDRRRPPAADGEAAPPAPPAAPEAPAAAPAPEPAPAPAPAPTGETPAAPPAAAPPAAAPAAPSAAPAPGAPAPAAGGDTPAAPTATGEPAALGAVPPPPAAAPPGAAPVVPGTPLPGAAQQPLAAPRADAPPPAPAPTPVPAEVQTAPVQAGQIGASDARVQTLSQPVEVRPVTAERGERISEAPRYDLPPDVKVERRVGDRDILAIVGAAAVGAAAGAAAGYFVRSNDDERLAVNSRERFVERLPGGRTRETIVRENGTQVVTISNRYGDVVQRSRISDDGRETVLFYDPYSEDDRRPDYAYDPGRDLPPLRVTIPEDRYIVDIEEPDEELYYDTLVAPPVETVERIYSVDEVRRSPRIREKVRRIDLATINFDFGSASVGQDQVGRLESLAQAIDKVIKENPGETFLIEGHTDAVGSDLSNLALSDKRAESVAKALTEYFEVPPENLVTQGYGEQELKVRTQSENRENRRVTVRRITALVKPVNTAAR